MYTLQWYKLNGDYSMHLDPNAVKDALSILNNEQVKNVLSPTTKAIGESLADLYHATLGDNLKSVADKVRQRRRGKRAAEFEDFKRIMPLLQGASVQSDDTLQDRWANLIDSAIDQTEGYLPSFGQTLSEMTAAEARYLDRLWTYFSQPLPYNSPYPKAMWPVDEYKLYDLYEPNLRSVNDVEAQVFKDQMSAQDHANYARLNYIRLVIQDLVRLGILKISQSMPEITWAQTQKDLKIQYALTHYGVSFIRAVSGTQKPMEKGGPHEAAQSE